MCVGDVRTLGSLSEVHGLGGVSTRADSAEQEARPQTRRFHSKSL